MRVPVLVYVLIYLVLELIGAQLAAVEWSQLTPLMVASAVTDGLLVVSVVVAALVAADLTEHRWRPALRTWLHERAQAHRGWWAVHRSDVVDADVVEVTSWRPEPSRRRGPLALPAGATAAPTATYAAPTYAVSGSPARTARPFPEDDGRLL